MTDNVMTLPIGCVSLSRISYHCDLQHASGLVIPLGTIAEMTFGPIRVLGLIARTMLTEEETPSVGKLMRHELVNPFEFLNTEFNWAWDNTDQGEALQVLASKHSESLFFSTPRAEEVRNARAIYGEAAASEWAKEELRKRRDEVFFEFLFDTWSEARSVPNEDKARLVA